MATPKQPQDHKAKIEKAKETDITIVVDGEEISVRGFIVTVHETTVEVEKDAVQSWDFAEAASDHDIVRMARLILGDRYAEIRDSFRDARGRADIKKLSELVGAIVEALPNS
jgi:hypothetical protein